MITNKPLPVLYNIKSECCGCTACYAICSRSAITMCSDEEGFAYPYINEEKCILSGLRELQFRKNNIYQNSTCKG